MKFEPHWHASEIDFSPRPRPMHRLTTSTVVSAPNVDSRFGSKHTRSRHADNMWIRLRARIEILYVFSAKFVLESHCRLPQFFKHSRHKQLHQGVIYHSQSGSRFNKGGCCWCWHFVSPWHLLIQPKTSSACQGWGPGLALQLNHDGWYRQRTRRCRTGRSNFPLAFTTKSGSPSVAS